MSKKIERVEYGKYTQIDIIKRNSADLFGYYQLRMNDSFFPVKFNSVSFHDNGITIFTVTGSVYAGIGKTLKFDILNHPNGVVNAEITAMEVTDENG